MLNILLRINDSCNGISSNRTIGTKQDIVRLCFKSLMNNIVEYGNDNVNLHVFYDDLSIATLSLIEDYVPIDNIHRVIRDPKLSISMSSFKEIFEYGKTLDGPILLLEDDYYFYPYAINNIMKFYNDIKTIEDHFCINIMEDFNTNIGDKDEYSFEIDRIKWRKIKHTTLTILLDSYILNKYSNRFMDHILYFQNGTLPGTNERVTECNTINLIYNDVNCYAPTPSLSEHLQNRDTLSRGSIFNNVFKGESIFDIHKNIRKNHL